MILSETIEVKVTMKTVEHYEVLGFTVGKEIDQRGVVKLANNTLVVSSNQLPKGSHLKVSVACDVCGLVKLERFKDANKAKQHVCSKECFGVMRERKALEEIEVRLNVNLEEFLRVRYLEEMKTTRMIAKELFGKDTAHSKVINWMKKFSIPVRIGSEAIKTQWIDAEDRRESAKGNFKKIYKDGSVRKKMAEIMQTEEYKGKSRDAKLGDKNPMYGLRGKDSPKFNPDISDQERVNKRKTYEDTAWRKAVIEKYGNECQKCGTSDNINAHHIYNHKNHIELRYEVDNGIALCKGCHVGFHKIHGSKDNNRVQLEEYLKEE